MPRVKKGMTIEEVRLLWLPRAEAKTRAIMGSYHAQRDRSGGGYGHEGLGVYGMFQDRAAREKVRLAAKLLEKAGHEVTYQSIRKVTGQSTSTIGHYWSPPRPHEPDPVPGEPEDETYRIIRFPGRS